jgi:hypothetical protein
MAKVTVNVNDIFYEENKSIYNLASLRNKTENPS